MDEPLDILAELRADAAEHGPDAPDLARLWTTAADEIERLRAAAAARPICEDHLLKHGAEAEALRRGIESVIAWWEKPGAKRRRIDLTGRLRGLLDRVDAGESLAWLEEREALRHLDEDDVERPPDLNAAEFARLRGDGLRPEVLAFAGLMEEKLREHDEHKGARSWKDDAAHLLLARVCDELAEVLGTLTVEPKAALCFAVATLDLQRAAGMLRTFGPCGPGIARATKETAGELADVGNMLMMAADVLGALGDPKEETDAR